MNWNLLIVDDENEILSWLEELFRYEFDMEVGVYTAGSATEAIRLLAKVRFDVVLTDIRMPGMDGITLFKHVKENWPGCKTVFLTGYRNFEDVYQVINHRDVQYVLKSEDDDVILSAVRKAFLMCRSELEQKQRQEKQDEWMTEAKYWLRNEFMQELCDGRLPENLEERLHQLDIGLCNAGKMLVFLIRMENNWKDERVEDRYRKRKELAGILQENVPARLNTYVHIMENDYELLFVQPADAEAENWEITGVIAQGMVEYAQERFGRLYGMSFSAVMMSAPVAFDEIGSCLGAMKKYMVGYVGGARGAILKMDTAPAGKAEADSNYGSARIAVLRNLMELHKKQEYFVQLGDFLQAMTRKTSRHDTVALEIYYSISIFLLQFINENYLNEQLAFRVGIYKLTMAHAHRDWTEAADYLTEVSGAIFDFLDENENSLSDRAIRRVVDYIDGHLKDELSLTTLAEIGGFNASYLSRLFKQLQKQTISEYILQKRMGLAMELLANTNEKIQDIAAKTGYLSAHSFTRVFRNEMKISPTEYREMKKGNQ